MSRTEPSAPEMILGKYHIVRPLKVGGTAAIYLAVLRGENNFSREVVIKRPLPHLVADARARLMFIDEAHIASRLSHPNIAQVLDLVAREDELYLVLEYLKGVDLREILKRSMELGRLLPAEVAVWIGIETCAGLDYAHEATGIDGRPLNLIHRDVSPKNIRVTDAGSVKVIDFGIARAMNRATETQAGTIKGTLGYMSPEQILGDEIDRRSDIFAFGIVLFQSLTCRNPFDGPTLKERVRRLTQAPIPSVREFNGALDPEIEGIVARCLERDVDLRYQRMRDVQVDLDRYLAKLQVVSPRQRLITFLEEIFPDIHHPDSELKMALTSISTVTGRIDASQRLRFPDDMGAEATSASAASRPPSVSTVRQDSTQPTVGEVVVHDTAPATPRMNLADKTIEARPRPALEERTGAATEVMPPRPVRRPPMAALAGAFLLVVALAALVVLKVYERGPRSTPLALDAGRLVAESPDAAGSGLASVVPPVTPVRTATLVTATSPDASVRPTAPHPPAKHVDHTPDPPSGTQARLYFRTAVRLEREGKPDEARTVYHLAYDLGGRGVDPAVLRNLGVFHNRAQDVPKAKACFLAYLARTAGAADADRIRTLLSSYPPVKTVPCVDEGELASARRFKQRRGATLEAWLAQTVEDRLRGP